MTTKKIGDCHDDAKSKNPEEQRLLDDELRAAKNMNWYRRLQIIKLSAQKHTVQKLSEDFDLCQQTIRNYIDAYNEVRLPALAPGKSPGRPPRISHWPKLNGIGCWSKHLKPKNITFYAFRGFCQ